MIKINSLEQLKESCKDEPQEFYILLNGGVRSSKRIEYNSDTETFDVYNEIDSTWQEGLDNERLSNETNIVEAINKNNFFKY